MKQYIGVKIIAALPEKNLQGKEGYKVVYEDGYVSWSPKETFEDAYTLTDNMSFGQAFEAMRMGKPVARANWAEVFVMRPNIHLVIQDVEGKPTFIQSYKNGDHWVGMYWYPLAVDHFAKDWMLVNVPKAPNEV
jgi:hypothetical protein